MTTDKDALLREAMDAVDAIRNEHKMHGHITDASAHWLIKIKPRITAALAGQDGKPDPGFPYVAVMRFNDHTKVVRGKLPPSAPAPQDDCVMVPREPTHEMLKALCGNPVILAASDEQAARDAYAALLAAAKEPK